MKRGTVGTGLDTMHRDIDLRLILPQRRTTSYGLLAIGSSVDFICRGSIYGAHQRPTGEVGDHDRTT